MGQFIGGEIISGTYTPTIGGGSNTNVAASTYYACQYIKVGNVVTVSGVVDIDPTLAAPTATVLCISLPIASNLANDYQCCGVAACASIQQSGVIIGDATNNLALLSYSAIDAANKPMYFTFSYVVI